MFPITDIISPMPPLSLVDVGAMDVGQPKWQGLLDKGLATITGFEPVAAECERLNSSAAPGRRYIPYAIGDGTVRTLHVTRYSACTSLYEPNFEFLNLFEDLAWALEVVSTSQVQTHRLDDIVELREAGCDFLKLDIQGAERDALANATQLLKRTLVVETEVSLTPMYRDQPQLGEIDRVMRANGFIVHRYLGSGGRTLKPMRVEGPRGSFMSQHLWGDMVYVKDFTRAESLTPEAWLKFAVLMHQIYEAWDVANFALAQVDKLTGSDYSRRYLLAYNALAAPRPATSKPAPVALPLPPDPEAKSPKRIEFF
jgi:FkbM family methyltransferase